MIPAFRALGLPRNPFGELLPDEWAAIAVVEVEPLVAWLDRPGRCLQLLGRCGRGKTTHLQALRSALPGATWRRAGVDPPGPGALLLLDEADAVGALTRWRHLRRAERSAIAVHADLARELGLLGWEVRTVEVAVCDPATVARIAARRVEALGGDGARGTLDLDLPALLDRTGDDLRALTDALYDRWQAPLEAPDVPL